MRLLHKIEIEIEKIGKIQFLPNWAIYLNFVLAGLRLGFLF
jgi:hypothetical protein